MYLHLSHLPPEALKKRLPGISLELLCPIFGSLLLLLMLQSGYYHLFGNDPDAIVTGFMAAGEAPSASVHDTNQHCFKMVSIESNDI
ncbi:hypothetical protein Lser_V15G19696 [Lactuca serriola]